MSISVTLPPETEMRLNHEAMRLGSAPDDYIRQILENALREAPSEAETPEALRELQAQRNAPTIALLEQWRLEGEAAWAKMTPEEREQEDADLDALKAALNENRRLSGDYRLLVP